VDSVVCGCRDGSEVRQYGSILITLTPQPPTQQHEQQPAPELVSAAHDGLLSATPNALCSYEDCESPVVPIYDKSTST